MLLKGAARRAWVLRAGPEGDGRDHLPLKSTLPPPNLNPLAWFAMPACPCLSGDGGGTRGEHSATVPAQPGASSPGLGGGGERPNLQLIMRPIAFAAQRLMHARSPPD